MIQSVNLVSEDAEIIRRRRYGVIKMSRGRFVSILFKPWPKVVSLPEVWLGRGFHRLGSDDRCWLFFNEPKSCPGYLSVPYVVSSKGGTLASFHGALEVLDEVARIKRSDAIVCEVSNPGISDRLLARWGWERHVPTSRRRHFIKRFYGEYPVVDPADAIDGLSSEFGGLSSNLPERCQSKPCVL